MDVELVLQFAGELLFVVQGGGEVITDGGGEVFGHAEGGVVLGDLILDLPRREVW